MPIVLHILFIILILLCGFVVYGAWQKDFGRKHYLMVKRYFPDLLPLMSKDINRYELIYKIMVTSVLFILSVMYIFFLLKLQS